MTDGNLSFKNTMSPALGSIDPKVTPFYAFYIECNRKSLKFYTIAKIKVTSVLEIFVSLKYVMYIYMILERKILKQGVTVYIKKMGAVPKVRIGDKTPFLSRLNIQKILCKI